jgi:hypothetical protein
MVLLLPVPPALFLAYPLWAEEPQASAAETDWNNLQRLPFGTLLLIEQTDEKWIRGGLVAVASDALSLGRRKRVRGIPRSRVRRIWLLGGKQVGEGALIGTLVGGVLGVLIARPPCARSGEGAGCVFSFGMVLAGVGTGIGAAIGAGVRERILVYRAPPPGQPSTAATHTALCEAPADRATCARSSPVLGSLPSSLRDAYRPFNAERAARELARQAGIK